VARTDIFDLGGLHLHSGQGRHLDLDVDLGSFNFGGTQYAAEPNPAPASLDISRMTHGGYALHLRTQASLSGPCMRCLEDAHPTFEVDAREVDQPGGGDELDSPYLKGEELDLGAWAHDALGLALPATLVCRPECLGLCAECGVNLNDHPDHRHESAEPSPWAALDALKFD
jgi:uncharacterized protein